MDAILTKEKTLRKNIRRWKLNLCGLTVLTEAASGNYIYTSLIAALAGAEVYAFTKDSSYGTASEVEKDTKCLARDFKVLKKIKIFKHKLPSTVISKADIVTNLGFLRPLDKKFISFLKETAVIPLMWETWEFREGDLDLRSCWQRGIPVLGTNENHPKLRTLDYLGPLIFEKISKKGIKKLSGLKIVVLAENRFAPFIKKGLRALGAETTEDIKNLKGAKILIVAFHKNKKIVIGKEGILTTQDLKKLAPDILVVQLSGTGIISRENLDRAGISYIPRKRPNPYFMSWTLADLGAGPVIELHTAGSKVGEVLARARLKGLSRTEAEKEALRNSPAQDFSREQKIKYAIK